jgi:hypothetical protein
MAMESTALGGVHASATDRRGIAKPLTSLDELGRSEGMKDEEAELPARDRLEFRFRWDKSEHRRLCRTVQREARRGSKVRMLLNVWFGLIAGVSVLALIGTRDGGSAASAIVSLAIVVAFAYCHPPHAIEPEDRCPARHVHASRP